MAGKNKVKVRMSEMAKREERWAWLFIAPPFIGFMCFMAYPIVFAIIVSMSRWTGINSLWGNLVGLRNYGEILTDSKFWQSMGTTIIYMIGIPIGMILGIIIAMGLNRNLPGKRLLTTMYYVPVVSSLVAVSILWAWVFNYDYGLLNGIYKLLTGQHGPNWLGDEKMIKVSMIIFMVWKGLGGTIILYLAHTASALPGYLLRPDHLPDRRLPGIRRSPGHGGERRPELQRGDRCLLPV